MGPHFPEKPLNSKLCFSCVKQCVYSVTTFLYEICRNCYYNVYYVLILNFRYSFEFIFGSPRPHSFREPHPHPGLSSFHYPTQVGSTLSSPPLSPSITPSFFYSRLKTHLFLKSFPPWTSPQILTGLISLTPGRTVFLLLIGFVLVLILG